VLEKRGAYCCGLNPYLNPLNAKLNMNYSKDMCEKTLDILSRSVYMPLHCDWNEDTVSEKIELCKNAIKKI
jgi:hypothetical protein